MQVLNDGPVSEDDHSDVAVVGHTSENVSHWS